MCSWKHLLIRTSCSNGFLSSNAAVNNQYDSKPWQQDMAKQMIAEIRGHADWMGVSWAQKPKVDGEATLASLEPGEGEVKLLDYASGLGIASQVRETALGLFLGLESDLILGVVTLCHSD